MSEMGDTITESVDSPLIEVTDDAEYSTSDAAECTNEVIVIGSGKPRVAEKPIIHDEAGRLTSETLAVLIVDALVGAGVVRSDDLRKAIEIAAEEIDVRKALGDY